MLLNSAAIFFRTKKCTFICGRISMLLDQHCFISQSLDNIYNLEQKQKILKVMNECNSDDWKGYDITKSKIKKLLDWKASYGPVTSVSDIKLINSFTEKTARKLFDSILEGPLEPTPKVSMKIKGQVLYPNLTEEVRKECKTVLSIHIAVNSVSWALIDRSNYEVTEWTYHTIEYPDSKKFQITDILNIAWNISEKLPSADIYVMKAEATTLRAGGSDPNNPKVLAVNLQKAQMTAMIVALINAKCQTNRTDENDAKPVFDQKVYFLRNTLPYRLYGTLVGNERVSTEQTVEMLLDSISETSSDNSKVSMSERLKNSFKSQKGMQQDMLGHCLLLALTFMDVCIYRNHESIKKLANKLK